MKTKKLDIDIPSDLYLSSNESKEAVKAHLKLALAFILYQQEKLTIGKAAELAGLSRYAFEKSLAKNQIPISNLTLKDVEADSQKFAFIGKTQ